MSNLSGQGKDRINLSCLVEALSKFKKAPEAPGETYYLMVETMAHKIKKTRLVFDPSLADDGHCSFLSVQLISVLYVLPDGSKALTWEVV